MTNVDTCRKQSTKGGNGSTSSLTQQGFSRGPEIFKRSRRPVSECLSSPFAAELPKRVKERAGDPGFYLPFPAECEPSFFIINISAEGDPGEAHGCTGAYQVCGRMDDDWEYWSGNIYGQRWRPIETGDRLYSLVRWVRAASSFETMGLAHASATIPADPCRITSHREASCFLWHGQLHWQEVLHDVCSKNGGHGTRRSVGLGGRKELIC